MALSVFHPPIVLSAGTAAQKRVLLEKMRLALVAESNYYGALYTAGGMLLASYNEYDDSFDAVRKAIKVIEDAL